jgi:hypothetical protein
MIVEHRGVKSEVFFVGGEVVKWQYLLYRQRGRDWRGRGVLSAVNELAVANSIHLLHESNSDSGLYSTYFIHQHKQSHIAKLN